jgi:hypothetical protein
MTTVGPQVVIPLTGVYFVTIIAYCETAPVAGAGALAGLSVIGGAAASDDTAAIVKTGAAAYVGAAAVRQRRVVLNAGNTCRVTYRTTTGTAKFGSRSIHVVPGRIS